VHDVGVMPSGAPFLVMELLDGKDLAELLLERGPLPLDELVALGIEACEGLAEAHAVGIVHRDLKPSNLFLVPSKSGGRGTLKLLDFGISKLLHPPPSGPDSFSRTATDALIGSPYYMPPEQITSAATVDHRADLWSLGVVLFELATGQRPFVADNAASLLGKILSEDPPSARGLRPGLPVWFDGVLRRCLRRDPAERFQQARELAEALRTGTLQDSLEATMADPSGSDQRVILARRQQMMRGGTDGGREIPPGLPSVCLSVAPGTWNQGRPEVAPVRGRRWLALAGVSLLAGAGGWLAYRQRAPLLIRGSSTLGQQVVPRWRKGLEREGIRVEVVNSGTTRGLDTLIASQGAAAMLAASSRLAMEEERRRAGGRLKEHLVGYDALAIVVHVDNGVPRLSLEQLRGVFRGTIRDWTELEGPPGGIQLLLRPEELGGHEALHQLLGEDLVFKPGAEVVRTNDELVKRLQVDRRAISFASFTVAGPVRQVPVGKTEAGPFVAPSTGTLRRGEYPLVRPLVFYSWGEPSGESRRFLEYAASPEAQDALLAAGFVPVR
jgi:ABC-type phosphate transport system substrate-binding protein